MGINSEISWTHHTFNPWWGCSKVSPGCTNCYAEGVSQRFGPGLWGPGSNRRFFGDKHWNEPLKWNKAAEKVGERHRVFCASMADVFEDRTDLNPWRERLWELIAATPQLDWLLLTKRPENLDLLPWRYEQGSSGVFYIGEDGCLADRWNEPWPNVWIGTTAENQRRADERIPHLLKAPAVVRFLSCEPLLGPVDLTRAFALIDGNGEPSGPRCDQDGTPAIKWVIAGGESGPKARPMDPLFARGLRDQCVESGVAFHFKQWGAHDDGLVRVGKKNSGRLLDGRTWDEFPEVQQ